jgi:hypothetical protein
MHPDTIKDLFRNETQGVLRIGNKRSTRYKRAKTTERYSESAIQRLIRRLEAGEDPHLFIQPPDNRKPKTNAVTET